MPHICVKEWPCPASPYESTYPHIHTSRSYNSFLIQEIYHIKTISNIIVIIIHIIRADSSNQENKQGAMANRMEREPKRPEHCGG